MDEKNNHFDFDFTPIGQAIKKAREARGMTREELSGIIGYAPRHIQSICFKDVIVCSQLDSCSFAFRQALPPPFQTAHKLRLPCRLCHRQKCFSLLR